MADNGVLFRTAVGGFNKADVTAFLDKQNADFRQLQEKQKAAIEEKDARIAELEKRCRELEESVNGHDGTVSELNGQIAELKNRLEEAERRLGEKDGEIEKLRQNGDGGEDEKERKAGLYDDMSSQLGDILITANKNAETIISQANEKAALIGQRAAESARELKTAFSEKMTGISARVRTNAKTATDDFRSEVRSELETVKGLIADAVRSLDEKAEKLEKRLNEQTAETENEINSEAETLKNTK